MLKNGRHLHSQLKLLQKKVLFKDFKDFYSNKSWTDINIPKRKERGPTDILKALSATVGTDPTASEYKFPDDPCFYPTSLYMKRKLALSMESGKNSAKWIVQNHPEFFSQKVSDPLVKAYMPKLDAKDESEVTESGLEEAILDFKVSKAIEIFKSLEDKQIEITKDTKQKLLELCCFYNCEDEDVEYENLETMWYKMQDLTVRNIWKKDGFAEKLFHSMGSDCPLACGAIIMGRLKHYEVKSAVDLLNSPQCKEMTFPVEVYNIFLSRVGELSKTVEVRLKIINDTLIEMAEKCVRPNLHTLNSILDVLSKSVRIHKESQKIADYTYQIASEFKKLGVLFSLGSYSHLFQIYSFDKKFVYKFIKKELDHLLSRNLEVEHPDDCRFFSTVIRVISYLKSIDLANDLDTLLKNNNYKFLNCESEKNTYYKYYLELVFKHLPVEEAMVIYRSVCPSLYTPQEQVMKAIIESISCNKEFSIIPEIWNDFVSFKIPSKMMLAFLEMVTLYEGEEKDEISTVFYNIADSLYFNAKEEYLPEPVRENSSAVSLVLVAFLKYGDEKKASMVLEDYKKFEIYLSNKTALELCKYGLSKKNYSFFMEGVKCVPSDPDVLRMVEKNLPELSDLPKDDLDWLKNLLTNEKKRKKAKQPEKIDF